MQIRDVTNNRDRSINRKHKDNCPWMHYIVAIKHYDKWNQRNNKTEVNDENICQENNCTDCLNSESNLFKMLIKEDIRFQGLEGDDE